MMKPWDLNVIMVAVGLVRDLNPHRHSRVGEDCDANTRVRRAQSALAEAIDEDAFLAGWDANWEALSGEECRGHFAAAVDFASFDFLGTLRHAVKDIRTRDLEICKAAAPLIEDWSLAVHRIKGFLAMCNRLDKAFGDLKFDDDDEKSCTAAERAKIQAVLTPIYAQLVDLLEGHAWDFQRVCATLMGEGGIKRRSDEEIAIIRPRFPVSVLFNKMQRRQIYRALAPLRELDTRPTGDKRHRALRKAWKALTPILATCAPWINQMGYQVDEVRHHLTDVVALQPLEAVMA